MKLTTLVIPGRVMVKKNSKQISKRGGRIFVRSSNQFTRWEAIASLELRKQFKGNPFEQELEAHFEFHFANKQSEPDASNCIEGPQDCLQKAGIIKNDKQIKKVVAEKLFGGEPKTVIHLYTYEGKPHGALG